MTIVQEESGITLSAEAISHAANPRNSWSMDDADTYASLMGSFGDNMEMWPKV